MRSGLCTLAGGLAMAALGSAASAQMIPVVSDHNLDARVPIVGPYELPEPWYAPDTASMLYSSTTETGSRFNAGSGGEPFGTGVQQDVTFDDVPIPASRLGGATAIDVTRVTVGIRRAGTAPAVDVNLFWSTLTTNVTAPDTELDMPYNAIGTQSLAARNEASFITELVTFGDGTNTLFTAPLNMDLFDGYGSFLLGLQFSSSDTLNGWRITSGPDVNADAMWIYDSDVIETEGVYNFGSGGPAATFYMTIEGSPVPEPGSLSLLAAAGVLALRRRR